MLPLIIGGVTLTAIGYGVKKIFENSEYGKYKNDMREMFKDSPNVKIYEDATDEFLNQRQDEKDIEFFENLGEFKENLKSFYDGHYLDLMVALREIKNIQLEDNEVFSFKFDFKHANRNTHLENMVKKYGLIVLNIKNILDEKLDNLDKFLMTSDDFEQYSDEQKIIILELMELKDLISKALRIKLDGSRNIDITKSCNM